MKKFLSIWLYGLLLMLSGMSLAACTDDDDDVDAPYLEVSPAELSFSGQGEAVEGGQNYFEILANRPWTAVVRDGKEWVNLSLASGEGYAKVEVTVPAGPADEAKVDVSIANKSGVLLSQVVTVRRGEGGGGDVPAPGEVIYRETFGTEDVENKPLVSAYAGWEKSGEGAADVAYAAEGKVSVRSSGLKNTDAYEGASGPNVIFFGAAPAAFLIQKIALKPGQKNLKLTFGASYSFKPEGGEYDNAFDTSKFKVSLSRDGQNWKPLAYSKNDGDARSPYWILATADFTLVQEVTELYIRFEAESSSANRLDDVVLQTGNGGQEMDLAGGSEPVNPGEAKEITIAELVRNIKAGTTGTVDQTCDRYFFAVVQNDMEGKNRVYNQLQLAEAGAAGPDMGITLFGSVTNKLEVNKGDKVKVTLLKGLAETKEYNGLYQVTGPQDEIWMSVEKLGTTETVQPVVVTPGELMDYQSMTVTIQEASSPQGGGTWCTESEFKTHEFSAAGQPFTVYCNKGSVFSGQQFSEAAGSITGVVTVYKGKVQLSPRNMEDVEAFRGSSDPFISGAYGPINFEAAGGEQTISLNVLNQGTHAITAEGLDGILSASVSGTEVTVKAQANTEETPVTQTLKITVEGGNTVEVKVTVAAKNGGGEANYNSIEAFAASALTDKPNGVEVKLIIGEVEYEGLKLGTSSKAGTLTSGALGITGNKTLVFYAGAWKDKKATKLYFRVNNGGEADVSEISIADNAAFHDNTPFKDVTFQDSDLVSVPLKGLTEKSTITISTDPKFGTVGTKDGRAVMCGFQLK